MEPDPVSPVGETEIGTASTTATKPADQPPPQQAAPEHSGQLIMAALLRGLFLDEPWRHVYLRKRWSGQSGRAIQFMSP